MSPEMVVTEQRWTDMKCPMTCNDPFVVVDVEQIKKA